MPSFPTLDDKTRPLETQVVDLIPALRAFARTFGGSRFEADDLLQETLFRALRGIDGFEPGTNLKSWLFTIMHNAFRTQYKLRKREAPGAINCADLPIAIPAPQDWCVLNGELRTALDRLAPDHREVLVLVARQDDDGSVGVDDVERGGDRARAHGGTPSGQRQTSRA